MMSSLKELVKAVIQAEMPDCFSFLYLNSKMPKGYDYDAIRNVLFSLLKEGDLIRQIFDEESKRILLEKVHPDTIHWGKRYPDANREYLYYGTDIVGRLLDRPGGYSWDVHLKWDIPESMWEGHIDKSRRILPHPENARLACETFVMQALQYRVKKIV